MARILMAAGGIIITRIRTRTWKAEAGTITRTDGRRAGDPTAITRTDGRRAGDPTAIEPAT